MTEVVRKVLIAPEQLKRATELYEFGALRDSIMAGQSNLYGAIGEVLFADEHPEWLRAESFNHDFVRQTEELGELTVDVKTKRTTTTPQPDWNCSVAATSRHQQPDYLYFIRVHEDLSVAWLLGWLPLAEFYDVAVFGAKGEPDPSMPSWRYRADCWNVRVSQLRSIEASREDANV
jgi:hypothetical protein